MAKIAYWYSKWIDYQTIRTVLVGGGKGGGSVLGACSYCPNSKRSVEAHDRIERAIERKAETRGYTILS